MSWVVIWVTPCNQKLGPLKSDSSWVMVKHKIRGWELPGGQIHDKESIQDAASRELMEETGLQGQLRGFNSNLLAGGHVVWITVPNTVNAFSWQSPDKNILEVSWFLSPPDELHWGVEELHCIANYWSNFATSKS